MTSSLKTPFAALLAALLLTSGCTVQRSLAIGTPAALREQVGTAAPPPWRLGEVHVSVEGMSTNGVAGSPATGVDYGPYKQQLADRLKATLLSQKALGATVDGAAYVLEVDVKGREVYGVGRQLWLSLLLETAVLALGFGVGLGVDLSPARPPGDLRMNGVLIGGLGSIPLALGVATIPELGGATGTFEAQLVLRRLADRVPVAQRRVESTWRADYNLYSVPEKLAAASGQGVSVFEQELLTALVELLQDSQAVALAAPAAR